MSDKSKPVQSKPEIELKPSDPPFLFVTLLSARKSGDRMLESLARGWLADQGIVVHFKRKKEGTG